MKLKLFKSLLLAVSLPGLLTAAFAANAEKTCFELLDAGYYEEALSQCTAQANLGDPSAQSNLGSMSFSGKGVPQNYKRALSWYTKAAEQGYADAQAALGAMYYFGQGVLKDIVEAYAWWNLAAAQGNKSARNDIGIVEKEMTPSQIAKAQELSKVYYKKYDIK